MSVDSEQTFKGVHFSRCFQVRTVQQKLSDWYGSLCPLVECLTARSVVQVVAFVVNEIGLHGLGQVFLREDLGSSVNVVVTLLKGSDGLFEVERLAIGLVGVHEGLQLHGLVIELHLVDLLDDADLDMSLLSDLAAIGVGDADGKNVEVPLGSDARLDVLADLDRNLDSVEALGRDLSNWDLDIFDEDVTVLGHVLKMEAFLVRPVSVVHEGDFDLDLVASTGRDHVGNFLGDGSAGVHAAAVFLLLAAALPLAATLGAFTVALAFAATEHVSHEPADLLLHDLGVHALGGFSFLVHLGHLGAKLAHALAPRLHLLSKLFRVASAGTKVVTMTMRTMMMRRRTVRAVVTMVATSTPSSPAATARAASAEREGRSLIDLAVNIGRHVLIDNREHGTRSLLRVVDLEESVRMSLSLLALLTVVEILADSALVARTRDGSDTAAVAFYTHMNALSQIRGLSLLGADLVRHVGVDLFGTGSFHGRLSLAKNLLGLLLHDTVDELFGVCHHRLLEHFLDSLLMFFELLLVFLSAEAGDTDCSVHHAAFRLLVVVSVRAARFIILRLILELQLGHRLGNLLLKVFLKGLLSRSKLVLDHDLEVSGRLRLSPLVGRLQILVIRDCDNITAVISVLEGVVGLGRRRVLGVDGNNLHERIEGVGILA